MVRKNFFEILDSMGFDAILEYNNLNKLLAKKTRLYYGKSYSINGVFSERFLEYPNRGTFTRYEDLIEYLEDSLDEENVLFVFSELLLDYFNFLSKNFGYFGVLDFDKPVELDKDLKKVEITIKNNITQFLSKSNHELLELQDGRQIIVEKNVYASEVSQIVSETNIQDAMKVLEYNHFANKGNIQRKQEILISLASYLEPLRAELNSSEELKEVLKVNNKKIIAVEKLFEMFNQFGLRHNNNKQYHADLTDEELEQWYDDIYTSTLFVILSLDEARILPKLAQARVDWAEQKKQIE